MADDLARHFNEQWQLQNDAAVLYERHLVPAVTAGWAAVLLERMSLHQGERVLDVACGTGVVARAAAERVGRTGRVGAMDINSGMLAVARSLPASQAAASVRWLTGSALGLPFLTRSFDAVLCQLGLQFFPDRSAALAEMRRVLVVGGSLGLTVYSAIEYNAATFALVRALDRHLGPGASIAKRAEHALGDKALLRALAVGAGFSEVRISTETATVRFPDVAEYVRIQLTATPLGNLIRHRTEDSVRQLAEAISADVAADLEDYCSDGELTFPQEAHILMAVA
jgi:SAM-dependent methyltransferase